MWRSHRNSICFVQIHGERSCFLWREKLCSHFSKNKLRLYSFITFFNVDKTNQMNPFDTPCSYFLKILQMEPWYSTGERVVHTFQYLPHRMRRDVIERHVSRRCLSYTVALSLIDSSSRKTNTRIPTFSYRCDVCIQPSATRLWEV